MRVGLGRRHAPQFRQVGEDAGSHVLQDCPRQSDIGQHDLAAEHVARQQQMPGLEPEERDRQRCLRRIPTHRAGRAVEPARYIDSHHTPRGAQRIGDQSVNFARKAGPKHRVDHQFRALCF